MEIDQPNLARKIFRGRSSGIVLLEFIGLIHVSRAVFSLAARDVVDLRVTNTYHLSIVKITLLDFTTIHEGTVGTAQVDQLDTSEEMSSNA